MITINGKEFRNLVEQVAKNQEDIKKHYEIEQTLADWGIKVIGRLDEWEAPTGSFSFGDAYAVGPEGGPFDFYIWTRRSDLDDEGYWLNYGPISIVGPQGPEGPQGPQGETGKANRWYVGPSEPTGDITEGDMWLKLNSDNTTNGFVYQYLSSGWALFTTIMGPRGLTGKDGNEGKQGPPGPQGPQGKDGNPSPVINIIAELPEGTVISDIYDPANVESNSGILMPVGGVNHLWIIINGNWTDSGSWGQGGTRVYVGGEEVVEFNADTKVDKLGPPPYTGQTRAYIQDANGVISGRNIAIGDGFASAGAIVCYYSEVAGNTPPSGYLVSNTPKKAGQVANKKYVDEKIEQRIWALHDYQQHGNFSWTANDEFDFTIGIGQIAENVILNYGGDFTAWGGNLVFYGIGGLVEPAEGMGYSDNDGIIHRLVCRMDTATAELQCLYSTGQTWANATVLASFDIGFVEMATNQTYTITLGMVRTNGLYGGLFPLDAIPDPR